MMQEFSRYSESYEGRLEENERRVAEVIGSEARDAPRDQRSHMWHDHQVLLKAGERGEGEGGNSVSPEKADTFLRAKR